VKIEEILAKLTSKDERYDHMTWIGRNYSIANLKKDLKQCLEDKNAS
jgi:hypothetical protein